MKGTILALSILLLSGSSLHAQPLSIVQKCLGRAPWLSLTMSTTIERLKAILKG